MRLELETPGALPDACEVRITGERATVALEARRIWCEAAAGGRVEAGLAFDAYDAETHRELVELLFSDDRSWLRSTYPRDDPFRSFGYLLTTLWRVTRPRRPFRRQAPRLGRPLALLRERPARVVPIAERPGRPRRAETPLTSAGALVVELTLGPEATQPLSLRGRVAGGGTRVALVWEPEDQAPREALAVFLQSRHRAALAHAERRRPFWRRTEALRT